MIRGKLPGGEVL